METLEQQVAKAIDGDKASLEKVVGGVQDMIYNLALRMLWHPEEAKDASQEILIKLVTNLAKFEFRSSFKTWVYRLAANELLNYRTKQFKVQVNFDDFRSKLLQNQQDQISYTQNEAEQNLLINEAKVGCSHAMLQCLDRESRMTYIVGEILVFNSQEAATILNIKPEAFRKRLSRARASIRSFVNNHCGLVNVKNACRCRKRVDACIEEGTIDPNRLLFLSNDREAFVEKIEEVQDEVALFQSNPLYAAPGLLLAEVKRILSTRL